MRDAGRGRENLVAAATFVATAVALRALSAAVPRPVLLLFGLPLLLWGFSVHERLPVMRRSVFLGFAGGFTAVLALFSARVVWESLVEPPQWDFLGFWLNGRVAAARLNFYEAAHATQLAAPYHPSEEFRREILDMGFWYPPPSIFIFLPLGFLSLHTAAALWYASMVAVLGASILILWRTFLPRTDLLGLLVASALALGIFGTRSTFQFGQDNFLSLLALLLFWTRRDRVTGGVALALGMLVKPFLGGLLLYLALRRRWRAVGGVAAGLAASAALTLAVFGSAPFRSYMDRAHYERLPPWVYTEPSNQSLLATILRLSPGLATTGTAPMAQPAFLGAALLLTCVTAWCVWRRGRDRDEWAAASALLLALLVYPASQMFYCLLLVVPFLLLWGERDRVPGGSAAVAVGIGTLYALMDYRGGRHVFVATLLTWVAAVVLCNVTRRERALDAGAGVG